MIELPPLPEPTVFPPHPMFGTEGSYTAEAMREYAEQVAKKIIERCAKVCEEGVHNATDWDSSYWDQCCNNRAAAIRALKEQSFQEKNG